MRDNHLTNRLGRRFVGDHYFSPGMFLTCVMVLISFLGIRPHQFREIPVVPVCVPPQRGGHGAFFLLPPPDWRDVHILPDEEVHFSVLNPQGGHPSLY